MNPIKSLVLEMFTLLLTLYESILSNSSQALGARGLTGGHIIPGEYARE
jgi:hypothetical protein